jgi:hypothetical protein
VWPNRQQDGAKFPRQQHALAGTGSAALKNEGVAEMHAPDDSRRLAGATLMSCVAIFRTDTTTMASYRFYTNWAIAACTSVCGGNPWGPQPKECPQSGAIPSK